jgi:hypothetical protein
LFGLGIEDAFLVGLFDFDLLAEEFGIGEAGLNFGEEAEVFEEVVCEALVAVLDCGGHGGEGVLGEAKELYLCRLSRFMLPWVVSGAKQGIGIDPAVKGGAVDAGGFGGGFDGIAGNECGEGGALGDGEVFSYLFRGEGGGEGGFVGYGDPFWGMENEGGGIRMTLRQAQGRLFEVRINDE